MAKTSKMSKTMKGVVRQKLDWSSFNKGKGEIGDSEIQRTFGGIIKQYHV